MEEPDETGELGDKYETVQLKYDKHPANKKLLKLAEDKLKITNKESNFLVLKKDKSTLNQLTHEIQHAVQDIEGFSQGGSPSTAIEQKATQLEHDIDLLRRQNKERYERGFKK